MNRSVVVLLLASSLCNGETLGEVLGAAGVPTAQFRQAELDDTIYSFAVAASDPFLLAYYAKADQGVAEPIMRLVRFPRGGVLQRGTLQGVSADFAKDLKIPCIRPAIEIIEVRGRIFLKTHDNPSAGCELILDTSLKLKVASSGWRLGLMGDYAIVRKSIVHFAWTHPTKLSVIDLKRGVETAVYPYPNDPLRSQFARLIRPHINMDWCRVNNHSCDPMNPDTNPAGDVAVNESTGIFGVEIKFEAWGDEAVAKKVPLMSVTYLFRLRNGQWEHREFLSSRLERLFGTKTVKELVKKYTADYLFKRR